MRGQVTVSKVLNRHSEETFGLNIQIEEPKSEESRHPCTYGGFADAADASEEDAHVAWLMRQLANSGQSKVIRPWLVHKGTGWLPRLTGVSVGCKAGPFLA